VSPPWGQWPYAQYDYRTVGAPPIEAGPRSRLIIAVVVIASVSLLVAVILSEPPRYTGPPRVVIQHVWVESDSGLALCFLDPGLGQLTAKLGSAVNLSWQVMAPNPGAPTELACTLTSASALTEGFSVTGSNLPVVVTSSAYSWLNLTVSVPPLEWTGDLAIGLAVSQGS
jgi:hypothetical protein